MKKLKVNEGRNHKIELILKSRRFQHFLTFFINFNIDFIHDCGGCCAERIYLIYLLHEKQRLVLSSVSFDIK